MEGFNGKISILNHQTYLFTAGLLPKPCTLPGVDGFAGPRDDLEVSHPAMVGVSIDDISHYNLTINSIVYPLYDGIPLLSHYFLCGNPIINQHE